MKSEESLMIKRAQNGDVLAFSHLHDTYYPFIYRYFYYRLSNSQDAQTLSSKLFIKIIEKIGLYKPDNTSFLMWMVNLSKSLMKEYLFENKVGLSQGAMSNSPTSREEPPSAYLKRSLALLSSEERELIIARLIEKRPLRGIAREINKSANNTRTLQHIALYNLKDAFEEAGSYNEA